MTGKPRSPLELLQALAVRQSEIAVAALEEAHSLDAENSSIALHLAEVYQQVGRVADARVLLTRGLEGARGRGEADTIQRFEDALNKLTR